MSAEPPVLQQPLHAPREEKASGCRVRPILVRRRAAARVCGMGVSTFDRADAAGLVPAARKVGGCKLWCLAELREWAARGCPPRAEWTVIWSRLVLAGARRRRSV